MDPRYADPMIPERRLCSLEDIPDLAAKGFLREEGEYKIFAVRQGGNVMVYLNSCPHNRRPLEYKRDAFLSAAADRVVCSAHNAQFEIASGVCVHGPCLGQALTPVPVLVEADEVWISSALPVIEEPV